MSWELPDPPRDEDMIWPAAASAWSPTSEISYVEQDIETWDGWIARGVARLEQHLAKWAEFVRRHGP